MLQPDSTGHPACLVDECFAAPAEVVSSQDYEAAPQQVSLGVLLYGSVFFPGVCSAISAADQPKCYPDPQQHQLAALRADCGGKLSLSRQDLEPHCTTQLLAHHATTTSIPLLAFAGW